MKKIAITAFLLSFLLPSAQADGLKESTQKVIDIWMSMPEPKTDFGKWEYDKWTLSAITCANHNKVNLPKKLIQARMHTSGSFSMPNDIDQACKALALGPKAVCWDFQSSMSPFTEPTYNMMSNYFYISKYEKMPQNGDQVMLGAECNLVDGHNESHHFFAGPAKLKWLKQPEPTNFMTPSGPKNLTSGTLQFEIEGYGKTTPQMVVITP